MNVQNEQDQATTIDARTGTKLCPVCADEFTAPMALGDIMPGMCFDCGEFLASKHFYGRSR